MEASLNLESSQIYMSAFTIDIKKYYDCQAIKIELIKINLIHTFFVNE